jgi:YidC/Oxa1 family membrane protein insertase
MLLVTANIFQPLIDVFESVLTFFHNSIGVSWGFSIVLLTVLVRACLIPLTVKQFGSMQRMQQLQPELKLLQSKYKEDKQRQQQEMMKFYKENKVNPLGSCLPLVAQLPVFISLFYMLRKNLRGDICPQVQHAYQLLHHSASATIQCGPRGGAGFLFVNDLTNKATGATLIVLIVLYIGTQLASSLMMSSATMERTQRQIMLVMPLLFVLFVINFPAGVIVYWITTNTWTIAQQYVVKRRIGPVRAPVLAGAGSAGGSAPGGVTPGRSPKPSADPSPATASANGGNGSGPLSGLGDLLRGRSKSDKAAAVVAARTGPPPRPPRKKKKRSGRRR